MSRQTSSRNREWDANTYHRVSGPQTSWGKKVLSRLTLRGNELLLDAGCGTGRLTEELLQQLPQGRVVGVDLSVNMLITARDYLRPKFGNRVSLVAADLQDLPFERSFDGIFSTAAFHWVPDHARLFCSLFRALRPGGWLRAQCGGGPNLARLRQRMDALMAAPKYARFFAKFRYPWVFNDAEAAANLLQQAGFAAIETSVEPALTLLENRESYCEFVRSVILRRHLTEISDPALRAEFVDELAHPAAYDDPPYALDYWRLNLSGKVPDGTRKQAEA